MNSLKKYLLFILITFISPVFAANWLEIDKKNYVDLSTLQENGNIRSAWFKELNNGNWDLINNKKVWYQMALIDAKCGARQINTRSSTFYDLQGHVLRNSSFDYPYWINVVPDTYSEMEYYVLCGKN